MFPGFPLYTVAARRRTSPRQPLPLQPFAMTITAHAKINLSLRILGRRPDGYHELDTIMAPIDLADTIVLAPAATLGCDCSDPTIPADDGNLAVRAARRYGERTGHAPHYRIRLTKEIPHGAGLGGGSSDAAAVLRGLNALNPTPLPAADLHALATELGADVPFFLGAGPARCRGRGERLEPHPVAGLAGVPLVLVKPPFAVSTAEAYGRWAAARPVPGMPLDPQPTPWGALQNDLEPAVFTKYPLLAVIKRWLLAQQGVVAALMTGSGSALFALLAPQTAAAHATAVAATSALAAAAMARFGPTLWVRAARLLP